MEGAESKIDACSFVEMQAPEVRPPGEVCSLRVLQLAPEARSARLMSQQSSVEADRGDGVLALRGCNILWGARVYAVAARGPWGGAFGVWWQGHLRRCGRRAPSVPLAVVLVAEVDAVDAEGAEGDEDEGIGGASHMVSFVYPSCQRFSLVVNACPPRAR